MAPLWFKSVFRILRLFVREKLRDRVYTVSIPQLVLHVPAMSLPKELGGTMDHDHPGWLSHCREVAATHHGQLVTLSCSQPNSPVRAHPQLSNRPTLEQLEGLPVDICSNGGSRHAASSPECYPPPPPPPDHEDECLMNEDPEPHDTNGLPKPDEILNMSPNGADSSSDGVSDDDDDDELANDGEVEEVSSLCWNGHGLDDFIEHVRIKSKKGLYDEYMEIINRPPNGTFHHARQNIRRNRYTDILCLDHSRVKLLDVEENETDYINANFVDGYRQKSAFIFTQGPLEATFKHFWQMVWEQEVRVIVMTTRIFEGSRIKCGQYWPTDVGTASPPAGHFKITAQESSTEDEDFVVTRLTLLNEKVDESRTIFHYQFIAWPDHGVPISPFSTLTFLQKVRETQAEQTESMPDWHGHPLGPPIVIHCSAGIGRTGTFATLDIAIRKFEAEKKVDIRATVEHIRNQRAHSIQHRDQYVFCHTAFLEYALNMEHVADIDLTGFDSGSDSN